MAIALGPLEGTSGRDVRRGTSDERRKERVDSDRFYSRCPTDCTGCDVGIRDAEARFLLERPLQGGNLVIASLCCFLIPLAAALVGALLAGEDAVLQLVGAAGGLLGTSVVAAWIAGRLRRRRRETP